MRKFKILPGQISLFDPIPQKDRKKEATRKKKSASGIDRLAKTLNREPKETEQVFKAKETGHIKPYVKGVPKQIKEKTEKYANSPYNMTVIDAFRRAASEYKSPSKKLKKALEKDKFKDFIPLEYEDSNKKYEKWCMGDYTFAPYVGQKVILNGAERTIERIDRKYLWFEGCNFHVLPTCPEVIDENGNLSKTTATDIHPADLDEYIESIKTDIKYHKRVLNDESHIQEAEGEYKKSLIEWNNEHNKSILKLETTLAKLMKKKLLKNRKENIAA